MERLKAGIWFECAEVPEPLWMKSEEMSPFFLTKQIPAEGLLTAHALGEKEVTGKSW